jgi:hypothetical protein
MVFIIHDKNVVMLENPKAASNTLITIMRHIAKHNKSQDVEHLKDDDQFMTAQEVYLHLLSNGHNPENYSIVMPTRNPYTKVFSQYHDHIQSNNEQDSAENFDNFVSNNADLANSTLEKLGLDASGEALFTHVVRCETMRSDLEDVLSKLDLSYEDYILNVRKNANDSYDQSMFHMHYTEDLLALVNDMYASDFEHGGYDMVVDVDELKDAELTPLPLDELASNQDDDEEGVNSEQVPPETRVEPSSSNSDYKPILRPGNAEAQTFTTTPYHDKTLVRFIITPTDSGSSSSSKSKSTRKSKKSSKSSKSSKEARSTHKYKYKRVRVNLAALNRLSAPLRNMFLRRYGLANNVIDIN